MAAKSLKTLALNSRLSRRAVLKGAAGAAAVGAVGSSFPMPAIAQETTWTLANSLRSVANPYQPRFWISAGAEAREFGVLGWFARR